MICCGLEGNILTLYSSQRLARFRLNPTLNEALFRLGPAK